MNIIKRKNEKEFEPVAIVVLAALLILMVI